MTESDAGKMPLRQPDDGCTAANAFLGSCFCRQDGVTNFVFINMCLPVEGGLHKEGAFPLFLSKICGMMNCGKSEYMEGFDVNICKYWEAVLVQDEKEIRKYFHNDAFINWHCTNEHFNVDEFIIANCEYPGNWDGKVERIEVLNDLIITVTSVYSKDRSAFFHVTSFIKIKGDKIASLDEYWADDGNAPQWRLDKHIGKAIR